MASPRPISPARPVEVEIVVLSAKNLKNVNWRHGELKPYAVAYLDPERRSATKPDDAGSTRPVWNERLVLPLPSPFHHDTPPFLTLEIFHSKPLETPKPLVGTVRSPLTDLVDIEDLSGILTPIISLELLRPSGRSQGKIRIRMAVRELPYVPEASYLMPPAPPSAYYYSAPPPPPRDYRSFTSSSPYNPIRPPLSQYSYGNYSDPYPGYYPSASGYYSAPPAPVVSGPTARPSYYDRSSGYGMGPSAPVDYSSMPSYDQKPNKSGNMGPGTGLGVGAVAGALGGLTLEEGLRKEEGKVTERVEEDFFVREDYKTYRADY